MFFAKLSMAGTPIVFNIFFRNLRLLTQKWQNYRNNNNYSIIEDIMSEDRKKLELRNMINPLTNTVLEALMNCLKNRKIRSYPMVLLFLNINGIFVCGLLLPFYGNSIVLKIGGVLAVINFLFLIGFDNVFANVSNTLAKIPFAKEIGLVITIVLAFIGGSEYIALVATKYQVLSYAVPMRTMLPKGTEDWRLAHITADTSREADPVLWWRPLNQFPYNSQRFKGKEIGIEKGKKIFRIMCYGDSNTDGPDRGSWPEQLQSLLDTTDNSTKMTYEVLNAGVAGYSSHQGLMRFKQEFSRFQPDLVLVSFGWNDLADALGKPDKLFAPPPPSLAAIQRFFLHFRFYLCLKYYVAKLHPQQHAGIGQRVSLADYLENMETFFLLAQQNNIKIAFLTRPHKQSIHELEQRPGWRGMVPLYNRSLLEFGKQQDVLVIDVEKTFEPQPELLGDECHFTLEGHQKMAQLIYHNIFIDTSWP
jgi:lysophospholipase L1-like esterase